MHVADISSVKKLEMELLASEKKFKDLMERAPDAISYSRQVRDRPNDERTVRKIVLVSKGGTDGNGRRETTSAMC